MHGLCQCLLLNTGSREFRSQRFCLMVFVTRIKKKKDGRRAGARVTRFLTYRFTDLTKHLFQLLAVFSDVLPPILFYFDVPTFFSCPCFLCPSDVVSILMGE